MYKKNMFREIILVAFFIGIIAWLVVIQVQIHTRKETSGAPGPYVKKDVFSKGGVKKLDLEFGGRVDVKLWGAGGAGGRYETYVYSGGCGAFTSCQFETRKDDIMYVVVGYGGRSKSDTSNMKQQDQPLAGGLPAENNQVNNTSGEGGGGSCIILERNTKFYLVAVSGGGGGGGSQTPNDYGGVGGGGTPTNVLATGGNSNSGLLQQRAMGGNQIKSTKEGIGGRGAVVPNQKGGQAGFNLKLTCSSLNDFDGRGGSVKIDVNVADTQGRGGGGGGGYGGGGSGSLGNYACAGGGGGFVWSEATNVRAQQGAGERAPNRSDIDYIGNAGDGGRNAPDGMDGLVVVSYLEKWATS
jgi:hypothetical protein